jgi:sugar (pentulose or hexulose) kinase
VTVGTGWQEKAEEALGVGLKQHTWHAFHRFMNKEEGKHVTKKENKKVNETWTSRAQRKRKSFARSLNESWVFTFCWNNGKSWEAFAGKGTKFILIVFL